MFLRLYPTKKLLYIPIEAHHIETLKSKTQNFNERAGEASTKMALSPKSLAGPGYIILNGIRVMNIIGFLAVITGSVVMLVKTSMKTQFFFFDAVGHVLTIVTSMFFTASELSLFRAYFARNWPLFSPSHGFVTLALAMIAMGIQMLGNLNNPASSQKNLGLAFWRVVIGAGIVIFILGWINLLASYIFRDRKQGITARQVRAHGAVAVHKSPLPGSSTPSAPELAQSYIQSPVTPTKSSNPIRIFTREHRNSTLPSYHTSSPKLDASPPYPSSQPISPSSRYSRATACTKKKVFGIIGRNRQSEAPPLPINTESTPMQISAPMGVNPQFAHLVQRPDSALHPSRTGESDPYRWRPS